MMENSFNETGISPELINALQKQNITVPAKIQFESIKLLLEGNDVIGCSETGSGKTLAYLLPLFMKIKKDEIRNQAVIVSPTHELAIQIQRVIEALITDSGTKITSAQCIGGANIMRQIDKLKKKPHIIVGTAGRIIELIEKKRIAVDIETLIIDEADKMLDDTNFDVLLKLIKKLVRTNRQTVLFSASITDQTLKRAVKITKDAKIVKTSNEYKINKDVEHFYIETDSRDKILMLRKIYAAIMPQKALVFMNSDDKITELAEKLTFHKLKIASMHGRFKKLERKQALDSFRKGDAPFMVSSDISARGLDIKDVDFVINFDMPEDSLDYLHRIGRTARAGKKGIAISLVTPYDMKLLEKHSKHFGFILKKASLSQGFLNLSE
ncbi:MAG TPA: DEAD/DEAH box helicase [bacterium]|nr:DEAD/DEAH box helicase [bacterium]